ncbi:hypothetical protein [Neisseria wadsworthii]|uniref:hypothetical protein n=1 Tax=Neisseria wadsworthii TaxID=607711 RepID=UPI000D3028A0|nr:hypothetical protein [Neisseria wadsworthii]
MKKPIFYLALSAGLLSACFEQGGQAEKIEQAAVASAPQSAASDRHMAQPQADIPMPEDLLQQFVWHTEQVRRRLQQATPEEANQLYETHKEMLEHYNEQIEKSGLLDRLAHERKAFLDHYHDDANWIINPATDERKPAPALKKKQEEMAAIGLEYVDMYDGPVSIRAEPDYYRKLFGEKVSPDFARFIEFEAQERSDPSWGEADVMVSWPELGKRLAAREAFTRQYPQSRLVKRMKEEHMYYQYMFLLGMENTLAFDDEGKQIRPEVAKAWQDFAKHHPESPTTALIRRIENQNYEQAIKTVQTAQKQYFGESAF